MPVKKKPAPKPKSLQRRKQRRALLYKVSFPEPVRVTAPSICLTYADSDGWMYFREGVNVDLYGRVIDMPELTPTDRMRLKMTSPDAVSPWGKDKKKNHKKKVGGMIDV